jgi:signal transduction histidine kinase/DNA-binding response OmpR family regulator
MGSTPSSGILDGREVGSMSPLRFLPDLLLRRKLMLVMMLSSCATLLVACAAWFYGDWRSSRAAQERELALLGEIIGASVAPAVQRDDRAAIQTDLLALARRPSIRRAAVFDADGRTLASYAVQAAAGRSPLGFGERARARDGVLVVEVPIRSGGEHLGTVGIESDLSEIVARQMEFGRSVLAVLAVCLLVALALSYRMQRFISEPVLRLADTAHEVSLRKDYSLRAQRIGSDELGYLTDSFNAMLAAIQERDARLEESRATLEQQVAARTRELTEKNEHLQLSMEEAHAATVAKAHFLANMSHEIRTPMNGILSMNELLLETPLDEQQKGYAEIVKSSAEALLEIINDILDFSKIEAGKLRLEHIDFELHRLVDEVVGLLAGSARKKGLELASWTAPSVPQAVRGDPTRLRQVLMNLVGNALKFTERGRVALRVELAEELAGAARVRFVIEDTGIGIDPERAKKLFHPFTQGDSSTTRRYGGTGLGLAISKQLVELMQGEIGLKSELGKGSTFWFTARLECLRRAERETFPLRAGSGMPRMLVAEGSMAMREALHRQLAAWGFEHEIASDAPQALAALRRGISEGKPVGVLLLDAELCLGEDLSNFLRPGRSPLVPKVLLLTWAGMPVDPAPCVAAGTLAKPVRPSQLFDALSGLLEEEGDSEAAVGAVGAREEGGTRAPAPLRILLAEDNPINQMVAVKILAKGGFACDLVADGRQAVEAVRSGAYDVVLMDCQMPELDGFEATERIRARERADPCARRVHLIALTANAMKGDRERCLEAGMDDYLSKPVKPELLLAKLSQLARARAAWEREPAGAPFDVAALAERFAGRPDELRAALAQLERRAASVMAQLGASLRRADPGGSLLHLGELRAALEFLSSERLARLADELESSSAGGRFLEATHALRALEAELERCSALASEAASRAGDRGPAS